MKTVAVEFYNREYDRKFNDSKFSYKALKKIYYKCIIYLLITTYKEVCLAKDVYLDDDFYHEYYAQLESTVHGEEFFRELFDTKELVDGTLALLFALESHFNKLLYSKEQHYCRSYIINVDIVSKDLTYVKVKYL